MWLFCKFLLGGIARDIGAFVPSVWFVAAFDRKLTVSLWKRSEMLMIDAKLYCNHLNVQGPANPRTPGLGGRLQGFCHFSRPPGEEVKSPDFSERNYTTKMIKWPITDAPWSLFSSKQICDLIIYAHEYFSPANPETTTRCSWQMEAWHRSMGVITGGNYHL